MRTRNILHHLGADNLIPQADAHIHQGPERRADVWRDQLLHRPAEECDRALKGLHRAALPGPAELL